MSNGTNGKDRKTGDSGGKSAERRACPRYALSAEAEVFEAQSRTRMNARVSDLSRMGCYVEMMSPFPIGSELKMRIMKNKVPFIANGRVVYSSGGMGMGVRFTSVEPEQALLLEKWIKELSGDLPYDDGESDHNISAEAVQTNGHETSYVLNEVIIALMRKGVLTDGEGKSMLQKLIH